MEEANYTQMLAQQAAVVAQAAIQLMVQPQALAAAAQWSLVLEKIKREVLDQVKKSLKTTSTPLRLDELVDIVREEDKEFRERKQRNDEEDTCGRRMSDEDKGGTSSGEQEEAGWCQRRRGRHTRRPWDRPKGVVHRMFEMDSKAFKWCREALGTVPVLKFPDFNKNFILTTGAVILQGEGEDKEPITFASKKPTESGYSTIEMELFGIIWAVKYFKPNLLGRWFSIKTDHKPLVWIEKLEETSVRVNAIEEIDREYADRFLRDWLGGSSEGSEPESEDPWGFEPLPEARDKRIGS
ncbi:hypothetical protein AAG570_011898 [Ranatra chinensis]|uniref:Reverse transcriptase RNase H-like domain-containing protein n=1 Tax=Ranatra chinensis TaxID=642074 RepID=A0ABD0YHI2_9HEMI